MNQWVVRRAGVDDVSLLARHRAEMWLAMGNLKPEGYDRMLEQSRTYFLEAIVTREYIGWVVEGPALEENRIVAGGGLLLRRISPFPGEDGQVCASEMQAHVLNVFVEKEYRKQGLAKRLMTTILEWCNGQGIQSVTLNASKEGKPLYEKLGFSDVQNFMRFKVEAK